MAESDAARWDARYRERGDEPGGASPWLVGLDLLLPRQGRALDVAGGAGRNALWLARRGLTVTLADISAVALDRARAAAAGAGVPLTALRTDLEAGPPPAGPWDLIVCLRFLSRPLFRRFPALLAAGGVLVIAHPTRANLQRHARPGARYLLDDGELPGLVEGLTILSYEECWRDDWHEARLIAGAPALRL
jgi:tellurite methyltransferase